MDYESGLHKFDLHLLSEYSADQIVYRITNYYKFLFTRHPLERILSAYRSKWERRKDNAGETGWAYRSFFKEIINAVRKDKNDVISDVTFEEFVRYIIWRVKQPGLMETHWERYYKLCHMCTVDYNFIGKMETLVDDIAYVLREVFQEEQNFFFPNVSMPKSAKPLLEKYYGKLEPQLIAQLKIVYQRDFELFGYQTEIL